MNCNNNVHLNNSVVDIYIVKEKNTFLFPRTPRGFLVKVLIAAALDPGNSTVVLLDTVGSSSLSGRQYFNY